MNKLFDAIYSSDVTTIKSLVTQGYDLKQAFDDEDEGKTPLMLAASYGFDDMVLTILEHKPSLHIKNADGQDVFEIVANDNVNDRSLTREILSLALTQATIKKMKM